MIEKLTKTLKEKSLIIAVAESCTGGQLSAALTAQPGSSAIFDRGFITYSNDAKIDMLNVTPETLQNHGAVSAETASEMANGALKNSQADITASITGIAGPSGGTEGKPVGTVYIGIATKTAAPTAHHHMFKGSRADIQAQSVEAALKYLIKAAQDESSP